MYLIIAVLLFCIIVLIYSRGLTCYGLISMCPWDLSVLPYGEIVLHDNLSATEEFNSEINMIIVGIPVFHRENELEGIHFWFTRKKEAFRTLKAAASIAEFVVHFILH
ncbi:hypothetical protein Nmel_000962 [Mimus melanotis]